MFKPDVPITSIKEDTLGRGEFAKYLGDRILDINPTESSVIALYGPWGSGKTSILNMTLDHIQIVSEKKHENEKPILIEFNPWIFSEQKPLLEAYFQQLIIEIKGNLSWINKFSLIKLNTLAKALGSAKGIPEFGMWLSILGKIVEWIFPAKNLNQLKKDIHKFFSSMHRRIIIFIDDIDRLTEEEIKELFQLIKITADFPNTIYLTAFSRKVVEKALETEQGISGREYLQKIVQVDYKVPRLELIKIYDHLLKDMDKILNQFSLEDVDEIRFGNIFHSGIKFFFHTLRDVKRYLNSLDFHLGLVANEVDTIDYVALEAISVFFPEIYEDIANNKELFISPVQPHPGTKENSRREDFEIIFGKAGNQFGAVEKLCMQLFPDMRAAYPTGFTGSIVPPNRRKNKRLSSSEVFDIYFHLDIPRSQISESEFSAIQEFLGNPNDLLDALREYKGQEKIRNIITRFIDSVEEINDIEKILGLSKALLSFGDELPDIRYNMMDMGTDWLIILLIHNLLSKIEINKRCQWFLNQINDISSLHTLTTIISQDEPREDKPREFPLFSEECIEILKKSICEKFTQYAQNGELLNIKNLSNILFRWKEWSKDTKEIDDFIERSIKDPHNSVKLLVGFLWEGGKLVIGDFVSQKEWKINLSNLTEFVNVSTYEEILLHLKEDDIEKMPEKHQIAIQAFYNALEGDLVASQE